MANRKNAGKKKSRPGQLRIVAGNWRGRLLEIADLPGLRPTSQRVRETLFNWLAPRIAGARCLDLCAGTGALGLEALSRGAGRTVFVEKSRRASDALRRNIESLNAAGATVVNQDARRYLAEPRGEIFDIVFIDPPFAAELQGDLCRLLAEHEWLASDARIYIEAGDSQSLPVLPDAWRLLKEKKAGNVRYCMAATSA